jgi:L-arabinose isomerase
VLIFVENFNAHSPALHCAVGVDHIVAKIEKLGSLLGMEVAKVCKRQP